MSYSRSLASATLALAPPATSRVRRRVSHPIALVVGVRLRSDPARNHQPCSAGYLEMVAANQLESDSILCFEEL